LRFAAVLIVLAGYAFVVRAGDARIAQRRAENVRDGERLRAAERILEAWPAAVAERGRLIAALRDVARAGGGGAPAARFLRDAAKLAAARRTTIAAVTAGAAPAPAVAGPPAGESRPADEPFAALPLEVTLEGRYADVLATIGVLSRSGVPATVDVVALTRKAPPGAAVSATLRVLLHHIAPRTIKEVPHAAGSV
jgi:hypothetical protein